MKRAIILMIVAVAGLSRAWGDDLAISHVQYWIDDDYQSAVTSESTELEINCTEQTPGLHTLHYRIADSQGRYSALQEHSFVKIDHSPVADKIASVQYWMDDSVNQAITIAYTGETFTASAKDLAPGLHTLHYRTIDNLGNHSPLHEHSFVKIDHSTVADNITSVQYWMDDSVNQAITIAYTGETFTASAKDLAPGLHTLHYRTIDNLGKHSPLHEHSFLRIKQPVVADSITVMQYWWDDLIDNALTRPYTGEEMTLSANALSKGLHSLKYRVKDNAGRWSDCRSHYFYKGEVLDSARIVSYTYWWNDLADQAVTRTLDTPAVSLTLDEDFNVPEEARTSYAGHYTATLNIMVTDNRGRSTLVSSNVAYPDNDAPVTDIDADKYVTTSTVTLTWTEMTSDQMRDYNIYYSRDNEPFLLWKPDTTDTSATFKGETGSIYRFTVTGRDTSGNREAYDESKCVSVTFE